MKILNDFSTTVHKALSEIDPNYMDYKGLVVCGTHTPIYPDKLVEEIRVARETGIPFLGICFGHQLAYIEYARNILGFEDATSEEFGEGTLVVVKKDKLNVGLRNGETYWNNYEIRPELEREWIKPPKFITTQFHPEYQSSKKNPHPLLVKFLNLCKSK